jgi:hypothetical protein
VWYHLLIAAGGVVGLLAIWLGVQSLARRHAGDECEGPERTRCDACPSERAGSCGMRLNKTDDDRESLR